MSVNSIQFSPAQFVKIHINVQYVLIYLYNYDDTLIPLSDDVVVFRSTIHTCILFSFRRHYVHTVLFIESN